MDYLGHEWEISPAGGATGEAFIARHDEQKLFLKRNSSPFLAVLSAEGIVPIKKTAIDCFSSIAISLNFSSNRTL